MYWSAKYWINREQNYMDFTWEKQSFHFSLSLTTYVIFPERQSLRFSLTATNLSILSDRNNHRKSSWDKHWDSHWGERQLVKFTLWVTIFGIHPKRETIHEILSEWEILRHSARERQFLKFSRELIILSIYTGCHVYWEPPLNKQC